MAVDGGDAPPADVRRVLGALVDAVVLDAAQRSSHPPPPLQAALAAAAQRARSVSDAMESLLSEVIMAAQVQAVRPSWAAAAGTAAGGETRARAHKEVRRPWNDEEDERLLQAARAQGFGEGSRQGVWKPDWTLIADSVGNRKPKQCRERLFDNLDPTVDHNPLTAEEEKVLVELVGVHGTKWAVISSAMPQTNGRRPGNQLKNNWNRIMGKHKDRRREKRSAKRAKPAVGGENQGEEPAVSVDENRRQRPEVPTTAAPLSSRDLAPSSDAAASTKGEADRKRQRGIDGGEQALAREAIADRDKAKPASAAVGTAKGLGAKRSRLRERGVGEVVKQRLRKGNGKDVKEHYEYRCIWVGYEEAEATWETEVALKRVRHGPEKLVSAVLCLPLQYLVAGLSISLRPKRCLLLSVLFGTGCRRFRMNFGIQRVIYSSLSLMR
eukprot:COSAG02_NODE_170_length_31534_cov_33.568498_27_plen_439_part_00